MEIKNALSIYDLSSFKLALVAEKWFKTKEKNEYEHFVA